MPKSGHTAEAADRTDAHAESQLAMTGYVHTDERHDVLASLEHCARCLADAERSNGVWKWVVLSLHSALQGAMVCHLSGTARVGALTPASVCEWRKWHERDRRGEIARIDDGVDELGLPVRRIRDPADRPPRDWVASPPVLFRRLASESERIESGCGQVIEITPAQRKSFERLNALRNDFTHFSPRGWSIEIQLIRDVVPDILDVIAQIAGDEWPFRHMPPEERESLRGTVSDLKRRIRDLAAVMTRA